MFKKPVSPTSEEDEYGDQSANPSPEREPITTDFKNATLKDENTFLTEGKPGDEPKAEDQPEKKEEEPAKNPEEMQVAVPKNDAEEVVPRRKERIDEHGVKTDGDLLESAVDALEPGYIDLGRMKPGTCYGMHSMQQERPHMGTIRALKRAHLLCLTNNDYYRVITDIERQRE